jgi:DHA1 family bicyclomycin/chloramphenicol resistance-like MFS transporter
MGFCMANIMGLAMQAHGDRAGTAAGLLGFTNSLGGAVAAPLTGALFGLTMAGVTTFMSILLVCAIALGLLAMRNEKGAIH